MGSDEVKVTERGCGRIVNLGLLTPEQVVSGAVCPQGRPRTRPAACE